MRGDELVRVLGTLADDTVAAESAAIELLDELLTGYPVEKLRELLYSDNAAAARAGAWIVSELGARAVPLMADIATLLDHPIRYVRFFGVDAVLTSATGDHGAIIAKAIRLIGDADGAVRWKVLQLLARATRGQLTAAIPHLQRTLEGLTVWLSGDTDPMDIMTRLGATDVTTRFFAAAAAARIVENNPAPLEHAASDADEDIRSFAREHLEYAALRRGK